MTCQSRQLFAFANCFISGFVTHRFFSLGALVTESVVFDTTEVSSHFKASLLWWKESFHKYSNSAAGDQDNEDLDVKSVPEKDSFPLAIKSALKQNILLPVNTEVS